MSLHGIYYRPFDRSKGSWIINEFWNTVIAEVKSSNPVQAWIFSGFLFATAKVASIATMIFFHIILHPAVVIYDFIYIFITSSLSFHGFITNQFNDPLPVGLLAQLVEHCSSITEGQGFESLTSLNFFRLSFRNCKSCVKNCDDLLSYSSIHRSSHIWFSYIHNWS